MRLQKWDPYQIKVQTKKELICGIGDVSEVKDIYALAKETVPKQIADELNQEKQDISCGI